MDAARKPRMGRGGRRAGAGRKPLPVDIALSRQLAVSMTCAQLERVEQLAESWGVSPGEVIRHLVERA